MAAQRAGLGSQRASAAALTKARQQAAQLRPGHASGTSISGSWTSLGPGAIRNSFYGGTASGRVDAVAVTPSGEIIIGSAGGGVWTSTDGARWVTHTDQVPTGLAIGALAIDPTNPQIIYAGTGDANNCGDCFYGGGVLKSTDGGTTWTVQNPGGLFTGVDFSGFVVDPSNDQHLYAATTAGLYESSDGGANWDHPTGTGDFVDPDSAVVVAASHPGTVYVATPNVGVQQSTDGGTNFTTLGGGLPAASTFGVTALAIGTPSTTYPSADQTLYAAVALNSASDVNGGDLSMFVSHDAGASWTQLSIPAYTNQSYAFGTGTADQATYDNTVAVDPADPSHVIAGGIAAVQSTDGGATWTNINGQDFFGPAANVLHPDFHAAAFDPSGSVLLASDGGIFRYTPSTPGPSGVSNLNGNLDISLTYQDLGVSATGSTIVAGMQGTGTAVYSGSQVWVDQVSGDGGYSAVNPLHTSQQFVESDGRLNMTTDAWATVSTDITPPGEPDGAANFVPPMTLVPVASTPAQPRIYYGGADLWTTPDPTASTPTWTQLTNVGTGVSAIASAPSNPNVVYVGFDDGTLEVSTNATAATPTFTAISPNVSEWITHIAVSPTNPGQIALSFSSSNTHAYAVPPMVQSASVSLTGTPSATFTDQTGDLPVGVASNSVLFDGADLVVATDVGVFSTGVASLNGAGTSWVATGTGLPNVQVVGLTLDAAGNLYAATHGRGVWKILKGSGTPNVPTPLSPPSLSGAAAVGGTLTESHGAWTGNPTSYRYQWLRCISDACKPIAGATGAFYTITRADLGAALEVQESATNANGSGPSATSAPSGTVSVPVPSAASAPAISGTPRVGSLLIEIGAQWTQSPTSFAFQWWRCRAGACSVIPGASADFYTLTTADLGATIKVSESASNAGGTGVAVSSAAVGPIVAAPSPPPPVNGPSPAQIRAVLGHVVGAPARARTGAKAPGTFTLTLSAPSAGRFTLSWSVKVGARHVQIARLHATVGRKGTVRLRFVVTAQGKRLLTHAKRLWVRAAASFVPTGKRSVAVSRGFWLHR